MASPSSGEFIDEQDDYKTQPTVADEESRAPTGPLSDEERLRMLGYDVSLGRPLGFWGSAGMNVCHNSWIFDFIMYTAMYAKAGPLLFVIGYPFLAFFHLCLIGPFAELVSTFPVAGGMATWAWQLARSGIGGERHWGWFVAGFTLAMHLGKTIAYLVAVTGSLTSIYANMTSAVDMTTGVALNPQKWWEPVFYVSLVSFVAILTMTRIARNNMFWTLAGALNVAVIIVVYCALIVCAVKIPKSAFAQNWKIMNGPKGGQNWDFPNRKHWMYGFSRMIFMGLPLRVTAIDAPIQNPSRTVPRVLWTTSIFHYINVYITVIMFMVIIIPVSNGMGASFPVVPLTSILRIGPSGVMGLSIIATLCTTSQVLASTVITSRFIFALARDKGIPFSRFFVITNKHKEPWAAMITLLLAMYLSTTGWLVNRENYYGLVQGFQFYFITIPYMIPLILYVLSGLDLRYIGRSEFSLGRLTKPCAYISIAWLLLSFIQGCLPLTEFNGSFAYADGPGKEVISFLPMVVGGMIVVLLASWFLYGRRHYVGPIRALTIWTTGQDIDPRNVSTANPRGLAIRQYMDKATGRTSDNGNNGSAPTTPARPTFSGPRTATHLSSPVKSPTFQRLLGRGSNSPSTGSRGFSSDWNTESSPYGQPLVSVLPESGVLPHETQLDYEMTRGGISVIPESGLFPESVNDERSIASAAQAESQLFPEPPAAASRASRRMNFRPSAIKIGDHSYPLTQLTPPPRSPPTQTPLSPPPRTRNSLQYSSTMPTQMEAAQEESQLEPVTDSQLSFGEMPALEESQIHPGGSRDSFGVTTTHGSRSRDHLPQEEESFIEPAALAESQLEPRRW